MIIRLKANWHAFCLRINEVLLNDCLCEEEKERIFTRINYHKVKLNA